MDKTQISLVNELLKPAFKEMKKQFWNSKYFQDPGDIVERSIGYNQDSVIRKLGAEEYFRCQFYAELTKRLKQLQNKNKFKQILIGVEGKNVGNRLYKKRPDIFISDMNNIDRYIIIIELKVTGKYWEKKVFKKELKNYRGYCKINDALLFLLCYYESKPDDIFHKLINGKLKNNCDFNFIEGYAFPPVTKKEWIIDGELC